MDQTIRILSIDGGGIRGVYPARILAELEKRVAAMGGPEHLCDAFHIIAGTSTGGILATGLAKPDAPMTAQQLLDFYRTNGGAIFPNGSRVAALMAEAKQVGGLVDKAVTAYKGGHWWNPVRDARIAGAVHEAIAPTLDIYHELQKPIYDAASLENLLRNVLGTGLLSEVERCHLLVTTYDMIRHDPHLFKSWRARAVAGQAQPDFALWTVARATSAAPVFFQPACVSSVPSAGVPETRSYAMVDGGVFANNPAMCALAEAMKLYPGARIAMLSIGTGQIPKPQGFDPNQVMGALTWGPKLLEVLMDGVADAVDYQVYEMLEEQDSYLRLQAPLPVTGIPNREMDDPSQANIDALVALAETTIAEKDAELNRMAALLAAERGPLARGVAEKVAEPA
ncbi:patatin-like phospholipase family protein [Azospirillum sp. SYSU D00513]|uniref:patatin-like phospholipase family protein n=1 Tax=Azospirillum sp. SYSU D00513 TaxID=2812561 RepID=UPI001A97AD84|nr:patatin-like phospholipase family protein [Azospirillum sp. SYSU D00513]